MKIRPFRLLATLGLLCLGCAADLAAMDVHPLNTNWRFHYGFQAGPAETSDVTLPHTWNRKDAMFGNKDYYRGLGTYSRRLPAELKDSANRVFLKVNAAQTVADVFVDSRFVTQHRGGYTAFVAELTDHLKPGRESRLDIRVNNTNLMDVAPICGDFNIYGGLPRGVELIVTGPVCIAPHYYASPGVFFRQLALDSDRAVLEVETHLSSSLPAAVGLSQVR
ncbi:MAG: glycoside hydrolase family 2 protein, partial [Muribaculaceae bacterium]|nr:glycoside hydrolase family 2 protein [Muribaculaceae bacterium]